MRKTILTVGVAIASLLAANAFAQTRGEVDASQVMPKQTQKATDAEKQAAKAKRVQEGTAAAKVDVPGTKSETNAVAGTATKEQRVAATAQRRAAAADAVKKGQITSGEK
jgi:hypothetical protein